MSVSNTHPEYDKFANEWKKCRDAFDGQRAIHNEKEKYLPRLSGQTDVEYHAYRDRATFYDATGRTVQALSGMIFRKQPTVEKNAMVDFLEDIDLMGEGIRGFAEGVLTDVLVTGRLGVLVDYPRVDTSEMTVAQAQQLNARPYFKKYMAESIINWKSGRMANKSVLTEVRLKEVVDISEDEFKTDEIEQIRVLDLNEGIYRQRIYRQDKKKNWILIDEITPIMNGAPLTYIPFVFFSPENLGHEVKKPPLIGLVNINISHYKTTADLEHGAHFTGLPTAWITGVNESDVEGQEFKIGSTTAWAFTNPDTSVGYLEFTGTGLNALEKRIADKQGQMASLGAQMLTPETRRNESTETAMLRHGGEHSVLSSISITITEGINWLLSIAGEWMSAAPATIELNTDFMPTPMTPQMLKELVYSWQSGAISSQTLFENLKEGEIIKHDKEFEEETAEIQTQPVRI